MNRPIMTEEDLKDAAKDVLERNMSDGEFYADDDTDDEYLDQSEDEIEQEIVDKDRRDLFVDVVEPRIRKGDSVKILVDRDGERITTLMGRQCKSWDDVHRIYGKKGGQFKLQARSATSGKFLGQQSKLLGPYEGELDDESETKKSDSTIEIINQIMRLNQHNDSKMERLIERMEEKSKSEGSKTNELMMTLMTTIAQSALNPKKDDSSDKQMEMFKFMMEQQSKAEERQQKLLEKMDAKAEKQTEKFEKTIEKLIDKMANKKEEISWKDFYEAQERAKKEGKEEASDFLELLEAKAEEKAAEKAESTGSESYIDKGMKLLLPMLNMMQNGAGNPANVQAPRRPTPLPQGQNRRALNQSQVRASKPAPQSKKTPETTVSRRAVSAHGPVHRSNVVEVQPVKTTPSKVGGLPTANRVSSPKVESRPKSDTMNTVTRNEDPKRRQRILDITLPVIVEHLLSEGGSEDCALVCVGELNNNNIPIHDINNIFTLDDVFGLADQYGILKEAQEQGKGEEIKVWFTQFHARLVQEAVK